MTDQETHEDLLYANGVNGTTGEYGLPPMTGEELSRALRGETPPENSSELRFRAAQPFVVKAGVDATKLDEAGWGVIFARDAGPAIREALEPLLDLRREQAGELFKVYAGQEGHRPRETKVQFLARFGVGPGPVDPKKVPYYLLLVGDPETLPYRFQTQLDVQYGVGRIHFDTVEEYANYAASVVAAERAVAGPRCRRVSVFGVANDDDKATEMSARLLVEPLLDHLGEKWPACEVDAVLKSEATKANLARRLGGGSTPALLFTASHGMEFACGDPRQVPYQGALLCQDWPGPKAWSGGPVPRDYYFAGEDLAPDADLRGLIAFCFACYGAGTPELDEFAKIAGKDHRAPRAPHPFLAALPTKMLGHPGGGALAVIGHVERTWGYSFLTRGAGSQTAVFESAVDKLLGGAPVGLALEYFNGRYAELSTLVADQMEEIEFGAEVDPRELVATWTANNDARGYVVVGDPAVRLAL